MTKDDDYEVGYKKPPESGKFKPGISGNSKGRPKKDNTSLEILKKHLNSKITIVENGEKKIITKKEAVYLKMINSVLSGNPKFFKELQNSIKEIELKENPALAPNYVDARELFIKKFLPDLYQSYQQSEETDVYKYVRDNSETPNASICEILSGRASKEALSDKKIEENSLPLMPDGSRLKL